MTQGGGGGRSKAHPGRDFVDFANGHPVEKTGHMVVGEGNWRTYGVAGEIMPGVAENLLPNLPMARMVRFTPPDGPAPTSKMLEEIYFSQTQHVVATG